MKVHLLLYKERGLLGYFFYLKDMMTFLFLSPLLLLFSAFIWLGVVFNATPPTDMTDMNVLFERTKICCESQENTNRIITTIHPITG